MTNRSDRELDIEEQKIEAARDRNGKIFKIVAIVIAWVGVTAAVIFGGANENLFGVAALVTVAVAIMG